MLLYGLYLIPILGFIVVAFVFLKGTVTPLEAGVQAGFTALVLAIVMSLGYYGQVGDTMLVNGVVTEKEIERQNCPIGWVRSTDSFCTEYTTRSVPDGRTCTGSGSKRTCSTRYRTEYYYTYPWEQKFEVETNANDAEFYIARIDNQGAQTPPRFEEIEIGEPATVAVSYNNYIKGAAASLFNQQFTEPLDVSYPKIVDYYRVNRVLFVDYEDTDGVLQDWNKSISVLNSSLVETGANVIVTVTGNTREWSERLAQEWDAHNINDVVVTIGAQEGAITWVDVRSWSKSEMLNIALRDAIMDVSRIDPEAINGAIATVVPQHFELQKMEAFEYLASDITPPTWVYVMAWIILAIVTPALTFLFHTTDYFNPNRRFV